MKSEERFTRREKGKGKKNVLNSSLVLAIVVLLLLMVFVLLATPAAAQPVKVWVNAPEYVEEGATFVVTIDVDSITDFNTGMFDLSFNSSMVIVTDVEDGRLDDETIPVELWRFMDEDTIKVFLEIPGVSVVSGSGYLAKISFLAGGEKGDESVLDLSNGELVKYVFEYDRVTPEEISAEWIDTEVRIVKGEPVPTPTPPGDRVHNLNTSKNFSSIQAAIDDPDTKDGHVIEVEDGVYYENVDVTKALTIRSENGSASCIVQAAKANDNVFEITADHVCIRGFTVKDVFAGGKAGINLNASYCNVSNNNCSNNYCGILLEGSCNNIVSDNNCFLNNEDGILLSGSSNNTLSGNNCSSNNWRGIYLRNSRDNTLFNNNCFSNTDYGIILYESSGNRIYLNNFINTKNVYSHGVINIWNSDKKMTYTYNGTSYTNYLGNYWSDYTGEDTDGDGIGDSPYHRDIDNYPLMMPFENYLVSKQIYVPDDYPTIQQAVDNATEGNIIIVRDGAYVENVKVNKRLTIRSENGTDSTIVIAEDSYKNVFEVTADCVNINGFSMEGAKGEAKAGIYLNADHCYISNNNASNCSVGIFLLFADDNTITGNRATGNEKDGIYLNNSYKNELEGNKLLNNTHGIHFYNHSKNNIVSENEVSNNYEGIKFIESSNNWIYLNNFIENVYNARSVASNNTWNSTLKMIYTHNNCVYKNYMGNYWSDYIGTDVDKDGIGDAPYRIKSDEDRYPLMRSWQDYYIISNPIYVPDDYPTIQQAVNNATEGDVIIVRDGTYVENINVNAKKRLAIWSENGSEATIIQPADSNDHVFEITADYVRISGFMVKGATGTKAGIYLKASYCNISNNNVTNNEYGIYMDYSSNNTLTNNTMSGNTRNIAVYGSNLLHFFHNIDTSNTVDGKSIYYWVNQQNQQIPGDAGFVALVNCTNITVRDLVLRNNSAGVLLASANNSRIENVSASNNGNGIRLIVSYDT